MLVKHNMLKFPIAIYEFYQHQDYFGAINQEKKEIWKGFSYTKSKLNLSLANLDNDIYEEILNRVNEIRLFWIRYNPDIKKNMKISYQHKIYTIKQIENCEEKFHTMLLITIGEKNG